MKKAINGIILAILVMVAASVIWSMNEDVAATEMGPASYFNEDEMEIAQKYGDNLGNYMYYCRKALEQRGYKIHFENAYWYLGEYHLTWHANDYVVFRENLDSLDEFEQGDISSPFYFFKEVKHHGHMGHSSNHRVGVNFGIRRLLGFPSKTLGQT